MFQTAFTQKTGWFALSGTSGYYQIHDIEVDEQNNSYITGEFTGEASSNKNSWSTIIDRRTMQLKNVKLPMVLVLFAYIRSRSDYD